jgi:phage-related tail protein
LELNVNSFSIMHVQDLNASKRREVELSQELETQKELVKELQLEVAENIRAVCAEQVRWSEVKVCYTKIDATMITPMC